MMSLRFLPLLLLLSGIFGCTQNVPSQPETPPAAKVSTSNGKVDQILVLKSERRMHLLSNGEPIKTYRISLGKQPKGHKRFEGDKRTPEGMYWIDWRNPRSRYYLSLHVSYPNARDIQYARSRGLSPGGMIMIHGTPDSEETPEWYFHGLDWTDGCIALKNSDMREVWALVPDGTLIEIRP